LATPLLRPPSVDAAALVRALVRHCSPWGTDAHARGGDLVQEGEMTEGEVTGDLAQGEEGEAVGT